MLDSRASGMPRIGEEPEETEGAFTPARKGQQALEENVGSLAESTKSPISE